MKAINIRLCSSSSSMRGADSSGVNAPWRENMISIFATSKSERAQLRKLRTSDWHNQLIAARSDVSI